MATSALNDLYQAAAKLWHVYLTNGPGSMSGDMMSEFLAVKGRLPVVMPPTAGGTKVELDELIVELESLLRNCTERPEGLCFVTGEAGLIPRLDLHARCEDLLAKLKLWSSPLS